MSWSLPGHCRHTFAPVRKAGIGCGAVCVFVSVSVSACVCVCMHSACLTSWVYVACVCVCGVCVCVCVCVCVHGHSAHLPSWEGRKVPSLCLGSRKPNVGAGLEEEGTQVRKEASAPQVSQRPRSWCHTPRRPAWQFLKQKLRENWPRLFRCHSGLGLPAQMARNATRQRTPLPVEHRALGTA